MAKFEIVGEYRGESEVLDTAETRVQAEYLVGEYQLAFGPEWRIHLVNNENWDEIFQLVKEREAGY